MGSATQGTWKVSFTPRTSQSAWPSGLPSVLKIHL